jgi:hypothetical protein
MLMKTSKLDSSLHCVDEKKGSYKKSRLQKLAVYGKPDAAIWTLASLPEGADGEICKSLFGPRSAKTAIL